MYNMLKKIQAVPVSDLVLENSSLLWAEFHPEVHVRKVTSDG